MTEWICFQGFVKAGAGRFSKELGLPGVDGLSRSIRDWPALVYPGTLNVRIAEYPEEYVTRIGQRSVKALDSRRFLPEAELPDSDIQNNTLPPTPEQPERGKAQIWRAEIRKHGEPEFSLCWVVRRIGSGLAHDLELVSGQNLRKALVLSDGDPVVVSVEGAWKHI